MSGRRSRDKGKRLERQARDLWREAGWECHRTAQHKGAPDAPDVQPQGLAVHVEVKGGKVTPNIYVAMEQARRDCGGKVPLVFVRRDREGWLAVVEPETLFNLIRESEVLHE